jgi:hypothetical protein
MVQLGQFWGKYAAAKSLSVRCNKFRTRGVETDSTDSSFYCMNRKPVSELEEAERELVEINALIDEQFGIVVRLKRLEADTAEALRLLFDLLELQEQRQERLLQVRLQHRRRMGGRLVDGFI